MLPPWSVTPACAGPKGAPGSLRSGRLGATPAALLAATLLGSAAPSPKDPEPLWRWLDVIAEPTSDWEDLSRARNALLPLLREADAAALERALAALARVLEDAEAHPSAAEAAAELAGRLGHPAATLPLSRLLTARLPRTDQHAAAQQAAARAIGRVGTGAPAITAGLQDAAARSPHPGVRGEALEALVRLAPVEVAVPALLSALADPVGEVRYLASLGLARVGPRAASAAPHLRALLDGKARPHGHFLAWIEAQYPRDADDLRCMAGAAAALLAIGDGAGREALERYLDHPDWLVRQSALEALWAAREGAGIGLTATLLAVRLEDPASALRARALEQLRILGRPAARAWPGVTERALQDPDPEVRAAALRAASAMERPDLVVPLLADRLRDPHAAVREEADRLLARLARRGDLGALVEATPPADGPGW